MDEATAPVRFCANKLSTCSEPFEKSPLDQFCLSCQISPSDTYFSEIAADIFDCQRSQAGSGTVRTGIRMINRSTSKLTVVWQAMDRGE